MRYIERSLHDKLVKSLSSVPLTQVAEEAGIDRSSLSLFRSGKRDPSKESIDKLLQYYGLCLKLVPSSESASTFSQISLADVLRFIRRREGRQ